MTYLSNMYDTYPYYTEDGINKGKDYKCAKNEYGLLDYKNKRFIIKKHAIKDNTIVKKTYIAFKKNNLAAVICKDIHTGRNYVDNVSANGVHFTGTDKQLSDYVYDLLLKGYNIQDFYECQ